MTNSLLKQVRALVNAARNENWIPCGKAYVALMTVLRVAVREVLGENTAQTTLTKVAYAWLEAAVQGQDVPCELPKKAEPKPAAKTAAAKAKPAAKKSAKKTGKPAAKPAKKGAKK